MWENDIRQIIIVAATVLRYDSVMDDVHIHHGMGGDFKNTITTDITSYLADTIAGLITDNTLMMVVAISPLQFSASPRYQTSFINVLSNT